MPRALGVAVVMIDKDEGRMQVSAPVTRQGTHLPGRRASVWNST